MTIPPTNPTSPTAPTDLKIIKQSVGDTLMFQIGPPVVIPIGTRYQVVRSSVSSDPSVGTPIYDGLSLTSNFYAPTAEGYYFARAYAGSYYGPYYPASIGVFDDPRRIVLLKTSATSGSIADNQLWDPSTYVPGSSGVVYASATVEGNASFDKDSGTFFGIALVPTSYVNTSLGIPKITSSVTIISGYGFFTQGSGTQTVTLNGFGSVSAGVSYNIGVWASRAFGSLTFSSAQKTFRLGQ